METTELAGFVAECRLLDKTLAGVHLHAWSRPALGEWALAELVAHLVRQAGHVAAYLDRPVSGPEPVVDRLDYWLDVAAMAPEVAQRARATAAAMEPATLPAAFSRAWRQSAERVAGLPDNHLIETIRGPMELNEFMGTRVLEVVVHHIDLRRALDLPPASDPGASRVAMALLEGLLGGRRPRNFGRERFILAATGRLAVDDSRFPLLR